MSGHSQDYRSLYLVEGGRTDTLRVSDHPPGRADRAGVTAFLTFGAGATPAEVDAAVTRAITQYRAGPHGEADR